MNEVKISERITVDEPKNVEIAINNLTGKAVDFELIRKFILNEKNTMFYLDSKMNSSTEPGNDMKYLWLDTGFIDAYGNPLMICLHKGYDGYVGHYTGTIKKLCERIKEFNTKNAKDINKNYSRFVEKYKKRVEGRTVKHIENPNEYAIQLTNQEVSYGEETAFATALKTAGIEFEEITEEPVFEVVEEMEDTFTENEEEITIELLFEQMESMQNYIDELLERIENHDKTSKEEIEVLKAQNLEYKRALVNMRLYNSENDAESELSEEESALGHNLLGRNEKILVLGNTDIREDEMKAIAHDYFGFEKADFEFITDYEKVKKATGRICRSTRFAAVIFGNCPHKVAGLGSYTSIIEEFKQRADCPIAIDARTESGELKVTKQSFRNALAKVYMELMGLKAA